MKYFAYGSNMSLSNMTKRDVKFTSREKATLKGYKFIINKISKKNPNVGFANIIKDENSEVEGVLYDIPNEDILKLDKYEGFPIHYRRETFIINDEYTIVYIANDEWTSKNELLVNDDYKIKILEGKDFLSENYYNKLLEIKTT